MKIQDRIIGCTCAYFGKKPEDIMVRRRSVPIVYPRQVATYLLHERTFLSLNDITLKLGQRTTGTMYHGYMRIKNLMQCGDKVVLKDVKTINSMIDGCKPFPMYKTVEIRGEIVEIEYEQFGENITIRNIKCDNILALMNKLAGGNTKLTDKLVKKILKA